MKKTITLFALTLVCMTTMAQTTAEKLSTAYQQVAFNMFGEMTKAEDGNLCFSPLSAQIALSMLQNGAAGNTLTQMQQAFGTDGFSLEEMNQYNQSVIQQLTNRPEFHYYENGWQSLEEQQKQFDAMYPKCEIANALWNRPDVQVLPSFTDCLKAYYDAEIAPVVFSSQEGVDYMNGWVDEKTHGLIPSIYNEPLSPDVALLLVNALYFKAAWAVPFWKELTKQDKFYLSDGTVTQTEMMTTGSTVFDVTETGAFRCVTMPYANNFCMTVFVPKEGYELPAFSLENWKNAVDAYRIYLYSKSIKTVGVNLKFPKLDFGGQYNLVPMFKTLGWTDFTDFSNQCNPSKFVSAAFQVDKIKVDEEGTEAAAVTVIEMTESIEEPPSKIIDFFVDRPFYFTIENISTNTILFMGKVMNPGTGQSGNPTSIADIPAPQPDNSPIYDLSGRQLKQIPAHGIYIQNGKKYFRR